eukprot:4218311-Alexandrium_andersonii.AAC.1
MRQPLANPRNCLTRDLTEDGESRAIQDHGPPRPLGGKGAGPGWTTSDRAASSSRDQRAPPRRNAGQGH